MPLISTENLSFDMEDISRVLRDPESGIVLPPDLIDIKAILDSKGATKSDAARTIAEVMQNANKQDQIRLKAAELVLDLHGVRDKDGKLNKQPIFNFIIKSDEVNINQIFNPLRSASR